MVLLFLQAIAASLNESNRWKSEDEKMQALQSMKVYKFYTYMYWLTTLLYIETFNWWRWDMPYDMLILDTLTTHRLKTGVSIISEEIRTLVLSSGVYAFSSKEMCEFQLADSVNPLKCFQRFKMLH